MPILNAIDALDGAGWAVPPHRQALRRAGSVGSLVERQDGPARRRLDFPPPARPPRDTSDRRPHRMPAALGTGRERREDVGRSSLRVAAPASRQRTVVQAIKPRDISRILTSWTRVVPGKGTAGCGPIQRALWARRQRRLDSACQSRGRPICPDPSSASHFWLRSAPQGADNLRTRLKHRWLGA